MQASVRRCGGQLQRGGSEPRLRALAQHGNELRETARFTVTTKPNTSGQVAIKLTAVDAGGITISRVFLLNILPVADTPVVTILPPTTPTPPLTKPTLDQGSWAVNLDASLVDQDGSETLQIRISNVPSGLSFNKGSLLSGDGTFSVWSFTREQLSGLRIVGPSNWAQDLSLVVTAISSEGGDGEHRADHDQHRDQCSPHGPLRGPHARVQRELRAGHRPRSIGRSDGDAGDSATYALVDSAGGRYALRSDGLLMTGNYEHQLRGNRQQLDSRGGRRTPAG